MTKLVHKITENQNIKPLIIDVGCGQCYLSATLASELNLIVHGFDKNEIQETSFFKRVDMLKRKKCFGLSQLLESKNLAYYREFVTSASLSEHLSKLNECANDSNSFDELEFEKTLLISLHSCGDLSPAMLKSFLESSCCSEIINVGCCYQASTSSHNHKIGFPMSSRFRSNKSSNLLNRKRENIASQIPISLVEPNDVVFEAMKSNFYRSLAHVIFINYALLITQ